MTDVECANARRAAAAIALEAERARAPLLEQESAAKLLALRDGEARQAAAEQDALAADRVASEAAYEARWGRAGSSRADGDAPPTAAPAFGAPIGPVLPSMQPTPSFVFAEGADPLGRRSIEVAAAEPPANNLVIAPPWLEMTDLAAVPRPFRDVLERQ